MLKLIRSQASAIKRQLRLTLIRNRLSQSTFEPEQALCIFSDPRGGSTWLMEMLCHIPNSAPIFEPLHLRRGLLDSSLGFDWRQYIDPDEKRPDALQNFEEIFSGQRLNDWVVSRGKSEQYKNCNQLVFKFVRGNSLLPWLVENFEFKHPPILLLRHPIAVALSQVDRFVNRRQENEEAWKQKQARLKQNDKPTTPAGPHSEFLGTLESDLEKSIATWCQHNAPVLSRPKSIEKLKLVFYENLVANPADQLTEIFEALGLPLPAGVENEFRKPSQSSSLAQFNADPKKQVEKWMAAIDDSEKSKVQRVFDYFQVKTYSTNDAYPNAESLIEKLN